MRYGRDLLSLWPLDPSSIYLNHGTVGVVPHFVLDAQQRLRNRIERQPARFMLRELWSLTPRPDGSPTVLREAAARVAAFVNVPASNLAFVDNTTTGVNAVLASLPLQSGDDIVVTDHGYGGILTAIRHAAVRTGARVEVVTLPYPAFTAHECLSRIAAALTNRTRLLVVDHIASESALVLPVADIVRIAHDASVPVLVDGAHAPGHVPLDVSAIGADFYVANLHKWAMAPRSSGFIAVLPVHQPWLHPPVISWGYGRGFTEEFDHVGTRDPTPWLCAADGIQFLENELGGAALYRRNHELAWHAATALTSAWQTRLEIDETAVGAMVSVPAPERLGTTREAAARLRNHLLFDHGIEVQVHARANRLWVRVCAQAYNDESDIEALAEAVASAS
jgi:isopenicillin-N epimerase